MGRTALIVDDEADIRAYIASILEEHGWQVRTAADAQEAVAELDLRLPDVILLDLVLPGRTGVQFLARLRGQDRTREIPLILVTGIKDQLGIDWTEIGERLKVRRPDAVVEKPIDPDRLLRAVDDAVAARRRTPRVARV